MHLKIYLCSISVVMLIFLHMSVYAAEHDSCEISPILKSLVNKNPNDEAIYQYNQGRSIYLGVYGFSLEAPGVSADPYCLKDMIFPRFHGHIVKHSFSIHTASGSDYQ